MSVQEKGVGVAEVRPTPELTQALEHYFRSRDLMRRGICLLNAGCYDDALLVFAEAQRVQPDAINLPEYIAQCYMGKGATDKAAEQMAAAVERDGADVTARIRQAMLMMRDGKTRKAVTVLRQAVADHPDCAELHYQLGNLLAALEEMEEVEDRFTQAVAIDNNHADALVGLALCCGAREDSASAVRYLARAQRLKPTCPRIARLLTLAAKGARSRNVAIDISTKMPAASNTDDVGSAIGKLASIIEQDPEFVDAMFGLPAEQGDDELYAVLTLAVEQALLRRPEAAELHFQLGRALHRLDKCPDAVAAMEKAVDLKPDYVKALIQLAQLYQQTDRYADAAERLEQTLELGAHYADVYYALGNVYRKTGEVRKAKNAYENAIRVNANYKDANKALKELSAGMV